jgi:hypothetical protein
MKNPRRFLFFIPVETRRARRALVVGYYLAWLPILAACFYFLQTPMSRLLSFFCCVWVLPALLGGIGEYATAPVRPFAEYLYRARERARQEGRTPRMRIRVDEQDRSARDRAHYLSYTAFNWILLMAVPLADWGMRLPRQQRPDAFLLMAALAFILHFSLPQTILLWTEPDLDADLQDPGPQTVFKAIP